MVEEKALDKGGRNNRRRGAIEKSPLYPEIVELLQCRWSPMAIVRYLRQMHTEEVTGGLAVPSYKTIERWRAKHLDEVDVLPLSLVQAKLKGLDVKVDAYKELAQMVQLLSDRLVRAMNMEERDLAGILVGSTDKAAQTLREYVQAAFELGQQLGIYPRHEGAPVMAIGSLVLPRREMADDDWYRVIETAYRQETGEEPPIFEDESASFREPPPALTGGPAPE